MEMLWVALSSRALVCCPPPRNRPSEILPQVGWKIGDRHPDAVPVRCRVVKPFGRGEVEAETAGVPNGKALPTEIATHVFSRLARGRLIGGASAAERDIEAVSEMELGRERGELGSKVSRRVAF